MKVITFIITLLWLLIGLYFGIAGWQGSKALQKTSVEKPRGAATGQSYEYDGLNFRDEESLMQFLREKSSNRWFPWIFAVPQDVIPLIAALAFGLVGGAARLLKRISLDSEDVPPSRLFSDPLFGAILGLTIFFLSVLIPAIFTSGRNPIRPEAIVGFSLFGGIFSEHAFHWIETQVKVLFGSKRTTKKKTSGGAPK